MYIWEQPDWPAFRWDANALLPLVAEARFRHGRFLGTIGAASQSVRQETELKATTDEAVASSAIDAETLLPATVRSAIAQRLGLTGGGSLPPDRQIEGIADTLLDVTQNVRAPLTQARIFDWHRCSFAAGSPTPIAIGRWRNDTQGRMQVVSPAHPEGKPRRRLFQAPPAALLPDAVARFLNWFNSRARNTDGLLRAGVAHLWFQTLHPLDDGNGRIARAIADLAIARAENEGQRFYSLSSAILRHQRDYHDILKRTQRGGLDITEWLLWFLECHSLAIDSAEQTATMVIDIGRFWATLNAAHPPINERQRKVISRLLEGWQGTLTTRNWVGICGCSADSAQRDIANLLARGLLVPNNRKGRSAGYLFAMTSESPSLLSGSLNRIRL